MYDRLYFHLAPPGLPPSFLSQGHSCFTNWKLRPDPPASDSPARDAGSSEVSEEGGEETEPLRRLALKEECWPPDPSPQGHPAPILPLRNNFWGC